MTIGEGSLTRNEPLFGGWHFEPSCNHLADLAFGVSGLSRFSRIAKIAISADETQEMIGRKFNTRGDPDLPQAATDCQSFVSRAGATDPSSPLEQRFEIAAAVDHAQDHDVCPGLPVQDEVIADWESPQARAQVIANASCAWMFREQVESFRDQLHEPVSDIETFRFLKQIEGEVFEVRFGLRSEPIGH